MGIVDKVIDDDLGKDRIADGLMPHPSTTGWQYSANAHCNDTRGFRGGRDGRWRQAARTPSHLA